MGSSGLEPPTSRLSGARSNHLSYEPMKFFGVSRSLSSPLFLPCLISRYLFALALSKLGCPAFRTGGDDGNRTHDPLLAGQVLSQLSYTPIFYWGLSFPFGNGHSKLNNNEIGTRIRSYSSLVCLFGFCSTKLRCLNTLCPTSRSP